MTTVTERRRERHKARGFLRVESSLPRVAGCGAFAAGGSGAGVAVKVSDGRAGFAGLAHCGSVWACPCCSATIASARTTEIAAALREADRQGLSATMVTLTMRHNKRQPLWRLWEALSTAWSATTSGRGWATDVEDLALVGWFRVVEVTYGVNGWHVHIHAVMLSEAAGGDAFADELLGRMFARWARALKRRGLSSPLLQAQDARPVDMFEGVSEYLAKGTYSATTGAALELTRGDLKRGRGESSRTAFGLLAGVMHDGDADDLDLWHEYERASKGRRQLTWSKGLRARLVLPLDPMTDEEIVAVDLGGVVVMVLAAETYRWLDVYRQSALFLEVVEESIPSALAWLDVRQLVYAVPDGG